MIVKNEIRAFQKAPKLGTGAFKDFALSWMQIQDFLNFVLLMAAQIDGSAKSAHNALLGFEPDPQKKNEMEARWKARKPALRQIAENRQFLSEVILVRHVENYLNFLSSLLFRIFTQRPETLRSNETVKFEDVLKHDSLESMIGFLAQKKVESLSYTSLEELDAYFSEKFSLEIVSKKDRQFLNDAVEIRNISVHNRCRIDTKYLRKTGAAKPVDTSQVGNTKQLGIDDLDKLVPMLFASACRLDKQARKQLKLRASRFNLRNEYEQVKAEAYKNTELGQRKDTEQQ